MIVVDIKSFNLSTEPVNDTQPLYHNKRQRQVRLVSILLYFWFDISVSLEEIVHSSRVLSVTPLEVWFDRSRLFAAGFKCLCRRNARGRLCGLWEQWSCIRCAKFCSHVPNVPRMEPPPWWLLRRAARPGLQSRETGKHSTDPLLTGSHRLSALVHRFVTRSRFFEPKSQVPCDINDAVTTNMFDDKAMMSVRYSPVS